MAPAEVASSPETGLLAMTNTGCHCERSNPLEVDTSGSNKACAPRADAQISRTDALPVSGWMSPGNVLEDVLRRGSLQSRRFDDDQVDRRSGAGGARGGCCRATGGVRESPRGGRGAVCARVASSSNCSTARDNRSRSVNNANKEYRGRRTRHMPGATQQVTNLVSVRIRARSGDSGSDFRIKDA